MIQATVEHVLCTSHSLQSPTPSAWRVATRRPMPPWRARSNN